MKGSAISPSLLSKVDHAVVASKFTNSNGKEKLASSHRQLHGYLVGTNGNILRTISRPDQEGGKSDRVSRESGASRWVDEFGGGGGGGGFERVEWVGGDG